MVFGFFFWLLHNAIILLMERECNVSFFTKKSPGPQRKNEPKKSGNEKNTKNRNIMFLRPWNISQLKRPKNGLQGLLNRIFSHSYRKNGFYAFFFCVGSPLWEIYGHHRHLLGLCEKFHDGFLGIKSFFFSQLRAKAPGGEFIAKYLTDKPSRNLCANALY